RWSERGAGRGDAVPSCVHAIGLFRESDQVSFIQLTASVPPKVMYVCRLASNTDLCSKRGNGDGSRRTHVGLAEKLSAHRSSKNGLPWRPPNRIPRSPTGS